MKRESITLTIPCIIEPKPIFAGDNGFLILRARVDLSSGSYEKSAEIPEKWLLGRGFPITITLGTDIKFAETATYVFTGTVVEHPKYGVQMAATFCFLDSPSNDRMIEHYLENLPHIGIKRSKLVLDTFGADHVFNIIENSPEDLIAIPGITRRRIAEIVESWKDTTELRRVYTWLIAHDIPLDYATRILKKLKKSVIDQLESNPYVLADVKGIGFSTADALAFKILKDVPPSLRVESCVRHVLGMAFHEGHLCVPSDILAKNVHLVLAEYKPQENLQAVYREVVRECFVVAVNSEGVNYVYTPSVFAAERKIARLLVQLSKYESRSYTVEDADLSHAETEFENWSGMEIILDDKQREAVKSAFQNKVTVITGGGGTGKSTICRCLHSIAVSRGILVRFMAPTGAAAKVLEEKTDTPASTIHRALGLIPSDTGVMKRDPKKVISSQVLVVDEFSMVGIDTLPHLLEAILDPSLTNLVFVGDPQQLPSVSSGNFLSEIIDSGIANVVTLDRIHRQSERSYIPKVADDMAKGRYAGIPEDANDIVEVKSLSDESAANNVMLLVKDYFMEHDTMDGMQVISPIWKGDAGVDAITASIQRMVAPHGAEPFIYSNREFYVGDRVMQIINNYDKDVFNGNIGSVVEVNEEPAEDTGKIIKTVVVEFNKGEVLEYEDTEIEEIKVCWCCTVHKYQGSQIDEVIFVMTRSHYRMMSRELVYTGITRAKNKLYIVGSPAMLDQASKVSVIGKRFSNTAEMIRHGISGVGSYSYYNLHLCDERSTR